MSSHLNLFRRTIPRRRATALAVSLAMLATATPSRADLNSEVNDMFNNLGVHLTHIKVRRCIEEGFFSSSNYHF